MVADSGSYWLWSAGTSFTLCCALIGADALVDTAKPQFSLFTNPLAILVYCTAVASLACLICQIRDVPFPFAVRGARHEKAWFIGSAESAGSTRDPRVFVEKTPREFMAAFKGRTSAEAARIFAPYKNQRMKLSGILLDVGDWTGSCAQAEIRPYARRPTILAAFSDEEVFLRQLCILGSGTHLTIMGEIERIEPGRIVLTNCEILSLDR